jgi:hypothetical protein
MSTDPLLAALPQAEHRQIGSMQLDIVAAGLGRVKRMIYPPGFRWSTDIKPLVNTELCMHAHVGFLARGHIRFLFKDGCTLDFVAPQVVVVEPGHEAWIVGEETAVLIEFDFEKDTIQRFGLPETHHHD